jgi:MoxR-like ATPase
MPSQTEGPLSEDRQPPQGPLGAEDIAAHTERLGARLATLRHEIGRVIFGQETVIEQALAGILSGGHILLVGVPGLGKTRLVETLGRALGLDTRRVQFTPDLMPADILGSEVLDDAAQAADGRRAFRFLPGPVFCQLLMADEINRASPRTQSALLQAMQEGHVAVAGRDRPLPRPFHVLATQNPIEQEGTYPLPEAQLDRFLLQIDLTYPARDAERAMLIATTGASTAEAAAVLTASELFAAQALIRRMPVGNNVTDAILTMVRDGRPETSALAVVRDHVAWGPGPRAAQALMLASRARALLDGRVAPSLADVAALAPAVLRHRMALSFGARADGVTLTDVIAAMVARIGP